MVVGKASRPGVFWGKPPDEGFHEMCGTDTGLCGRAAGSRANSPSLKRGDWYRWGASPFPSHHSQSCLLSLAGWRRGVEFV